MFDMFWLNSATITAVCLFFFFVVVFLKKMHLLPWRQQEALPWFLKYVKFIYFCLSKISL